MLRIIKKSIAWSLAVVMLFTVSPVFADNEAKSGKSEINDISRSWAKSTQIGRASCRERV